jgi:coenzyme F420-0:L-glutamate ligase/coenzyme F420-1:gamma-L-glutamate ligase
MMPRSLVITAVGDLPEIHEGDNLPALIFQAASQLGLRAADGDIFVVAQKIISKAEGRYVDLDTIEASEKARELAALTGKEDRFVECVLRESSTVLRAVPGRLIVRHRNGLVMANAGIDQSNVPQQGLGRRVLLLPKDADESAARLRSGLELLLGVRLGLIVSDSFGRPWRQGVVNVAIGASGVPALYDQRNRLDREGRPLQVTQTALADAAAAAAGLLMGEADESLPVVHIKGLEAPSALGNARDLLRPLHEDLFQ